VPYDAAIAERLREMLGNQKKLTEQKMFGGIGFMVAGNMAIAASSDGGILVRADPEKSDELIAAGARPMKMRGKEMPGWLRVDADKVKTRPQLAKWVKVGASAALSLPPKSTRR
jgi:TfoX/Sxy family transcriptional regulator of competence genes